MPSSLRKRPQWSGGLPLQGLSRPLLHPLQTPLLVTLLRLPLLQFL
jgi:hypothetical protein